MEKNPDPVYSHNVIEFVAVNVNESGSKNRFNKLKSLYEIDLNNLVGEEITWNELPDAKYSQIYIKKDADVRNHSLWAEQHEWLKQIIEKLDIILIINI